MGDATPTPLPPFAAAVLQSMLTAAQQDLTRLTACKPPAPGPHAVALQQMLREEGEPEEVEEMRRSMRAHEGWRLTDLLPTNWMIQINPATIVKPEAKLSFQIISNSGEVFDSYRTVMTFMDRRPEYSQADINKVLKLMSENSKLKSAAGPAAPPVGPAWTDDGSLPSGWLVRREERAGAALELFRTPSGQQLVGRASALRLLASLHPAPADLARLRGGLARFGWVPEPSLPAGYLARRPRGGGEAFLSPAGVRLEGRHCLAAHLRAEGLAAGNVLHM